LGALICEAAQQEIPFANPTSGAELWTTVFHPDDAGERKKYPAVVFVPGGVGFGSSAARSPMPDEYTRAGFVLGLFDPDGRGRSRGWENWNGKVHQDGLHALLKRVASLPFVDKDNIGVVSSSLGLAMAAGALGRYPNDPPVKYFIDIEGPTDRFYITGKDSPRLGRLFGGRTTADADWWAEREAVRTIQNIVCPYLRLQWEHDHVHGPDKGHAIDIINAATSTQHGGKGKSPWARVNGPENEPNRTYTKDNPPKWLSGRQGRQQVGDMLRWIREMAGAQGAAQPSALTFFAVHCEAHSANPAMWDALCRFVSMADRYGAKLTLMFNPQWAGFLCPDKERFECVKSWQKNGHEIAVHYHNVAHGDWNGHTNRPEKKNDFRYRGTVAEMMASLQKLAAPDTMLTMCMGPDARWDSLSEVEIDEPDYPDGILYDVDGMDVGLTPLMKTKFKGRDLYHLKHHFFADGRRAEHLDKIKDEFRRAQPGEILGVVTHEQDFARSPEFIEQWFQFCRDNKARIQTVRDIVKNYPQDKAVEVPWVRQEPAPAKKPAGIFAKVRTFQESLKAAKEKRADTSAAEKLDHQSREAAGRGDMAEAERLLDKAIESLNPKKTSDSDARGFITFVVNTHDWPHLEESAATVLRLIGIFEKNKVRGEFYFTPQIVEHYEQKRPDVIARLKESGMGISYHCRPPHPTYGGFEGHLRDLDDAALAKTLRDYETYRLDPATGELQRDKAGGYSYVAKVLGCKPVVVSPQCRDPRIRSAALKTYADLGAKMVVAYHESGTKLEQPFEWVQGLLARPSDFSITRWSVGGRQEVFWWNMLDTPDAAGFNPTARLKSQLAAWKGQRAPFITVLIHENDFARANGTGWGGIYYDGDGPRSRPKQPPFDLNAPDRSRPRTPEAQERIWRAYEELVAHATANLRVVTAAEVVATASRE
jgi:hypothetical protein